MLSGYPICSTPNRSQIVLGHQVCLKRYENTKHTKNVKHKKVDRDVTCYFFSCFFSSFRMLFEISDVDNDDS